MGIQEVNDATFASQVLEADTPVLVDFWATWCAPCKALSPKVEAVANDFGDKLRVVKVDIDGARKSAMNYNVRSVPTLVLFNKGQPVGQLVGNQSQAKIEALVSEAVGFNQDF